MNLTDLLNRLDSVKGGNGQYMARCPAHDDKNASLSVGVGDDGRILLKCHAGCSTEDITAALGLTMKDLFTEDKAFPAYAETKRKKPPIVATYQYPGGVEKLRREDKSFLWRCPDGKGGWDWHKPKGKLLYVAGVIEPGDVILVVEGEKDADNLAALGYVAVTGPDGAGPGKWKKNADVEPLRGCRVCVIPDHDQVGRDYAEETCASLHGVAASVRLLDLSTVWPEIPEHGDVSDMLAALGDEEACKRLTHLIVHTEIWKPRNKTAAEDKKPKLVKAADIPYEPPRWTIPPYFQRGKGTLIQGDNGTGKTAFVCGIVAHVSTGRPLLELPVMAPGDVIICSVEDDLPVLRGRLEADGADLNKCHFMTNAGGLKFTDPDVEVLIKEVRAKMIVFDPFQAFLGAKVDMFRSNETRPELAKLFEMCDRNDCSCVIITHTGKAGDKSPVNRSLGSVDIPAAMRSILELTKNPDNEEERIMVHVKCSNAPRGQSIAYTIGDRGGVHWIGFSPMTAEDLTIAVKRKEKGIHYENEPLVQVFNQLVTDRPGGGFWSYTDLKSEGAKILGFPPYSDLTELRDKLNNGLARELQQRDGLIVTHGAIASGNVHGIRIEQYRQPEGYQTRIQDD